MIGTCFADTPERMHGMALSPREGFTEAVSH